MGLIKLIISWWFVWSCPDFTISDSINKLVGWGWNVSKVINFMNLFAVGWQLISIFDVSSLLINYQCLWIHRKNRKWKYEKNRHPTRNKFKTDDFWYTSALRHSPFSTFWAYSCWLYNFDGLVMSANCLARSETLLAWRKRSRNYWREPDACSKVSACQIITFLMKIMDFG